MCICLKTIVLVLYFENAIKEKANSHLTFSLWLHLSHEFDLREEVFPGDQVELRGLAEGDDLTIPRIFAQFGDEGGNNGGGVEGQEEMEQCWWRC